MRLTAAAITALVLLTQAPAVHAQTQSPADAPATARLHARLSQAEVLRADFVQSKAMAAFKKPLVTRGQLVFAPRHGVIWKIEQPLRLTYVLREDRLIEIAADGREQVKTARELPAVAHVARIFRALLGGQTQALDELFAASLSGDPDRDWTLTLTPRATQTAQFVRRIALAGGRHLDEIRLEEAGGDVTTLSFSHTRLADALSPEESRLLTTP